MKFAVLGPTEVWDGDRAVEPGPARRRLVLAALLVDVGRVVPLPTLLDRVWEGRPGDAATATLQTYISRLRATLASAANSTPATVTTSPRGYALDVADDDVDARRFEALLTRARGRRDDGDPAGARLLVGEALALWRGAAYADFEAGFLAVEAARLHELRLSAYELAAELDLALGRPAEVVHTVGPLVAAEPLREPLRAALMLALYRSGRQADALRVFAEGRERLADLLGADPDPAVQLLHERILRQDPTLAAAPAVTPVTATEPEPGPLPGAEAERVIGRAAELAQLAAALARSAAGSTEVVAVVGEAGIGKSRLVEEVGERARAAGHLVAWGRCWEHEGAPALWPWVQVLRELGARLPHDVVAEAAGGRGAAVTAVVPELLHDAPTPLTSAASVEDVEVKIFDAVGAFLAAVARHQPLIVVIDDLQWADPVSRRLAEYVATHLRSSRIALVFTVRSPGDDEHHPDLEVLAALARLTRVQRIDLPPMSHHDVRALVIDRVGDDVDEPTAVALHARTGGNPFYIGEIVRLVLTTGVETSLAEGVPDSVRGVIRRRVQRLSDTDRTVLRAAAVVGRTFDIALLAAVTGVDEDDVDEAVDRATSIGLLRSEPGTADQHRFTHALLQETLLEETGPSRRARLHRRIAAALEQRRASRGAVAAPAERIAHHHAAAGGQEDLERAVEQQLVAVDDALARWRYPEVEPLLSAAIRWCDTADTERARALAVTARYRLSAFYLLFDGAYSEERRWRLVGAAPTDTARLSARDLVTVLHTQWGNDHGQGRLDDGDRATATMLTLAEERDDDLLRVAGHMTRGYDLLQRGRFEQVEIELARVEQLAGAVAIPRLVFTPDPRVAAPLWRSLNALVLGELDRAHRLFETGAARSRELGDPVTAVYVDAVDVYRWVWLRDTEHAALAAQTSMRSVATHDMGMMRMYMSVPVAWAVARSDLDRGVALADDAMVHVDAPDGLVWRPMLRGMYAEVLTWAGRLDEALVRVDQGIAEAVATSAVGHLASLHRIRAQVLRARGADPAEVTASVTAGLEVARAQKAALFVRQLEAV